MKVSWVILGGCVLGVLLGSSITWAYFGSPPPFQIAAGIPLGTASGPQPKLIVDERQHDFGSVEHDTTVRHKFRFTNVGEGTLLLKSGVTSCSKCTIAELSKSSLEPGQSTDVVVEYIASARKATFRQTATILTNDPEQQRVELTVVGLVATRYQVVPDAIVLSTLSAKETRRVEVKVYSFLSAQLELAGHEFSYADTASCFEVTARPLSDAQAAEAKAKGGLNVQVTVKPGLPLGPIRQTIRLDVQAPGAGGTTSLEVPISGTVASDISIAGGAGWNADAHRLTLGTVNSSQGASRTVYLLIKGDDRNAIRITPAEIEPPWLKVTLGEAKDLASGGVTQIPLTVEIPPGSPPANHLGTEQGKLAHIVLETTHPEVKQIRMDVKFLTE